MKQHTCALKYTKTEHQMKWNMLEVEWMSQETRQMPPSAVSSASSSIGYWRYDILLGCTALKTKLTTYHTCM